MEKKVFLKNILGYFWHRKLWLIVFGITAFLSFLLSLVNPFFSAQLLQMVTKVDFDGILFYGCAAFGLAIIGYIINTVNSEVSSRLQDYINLDVQSDVSKKLFRLELKNFDDKGTSFFTQRINSDTRSITSIFWDIRHGVMNMLADFGSLLYVFLISVPMGIYFVIGSILLFWIRKRKMKIWKKYREELDEIYEKHSSSFTEIIRGIRDIKVLNLKNQMIDKTVYEKKQIIEHDLVIRNKQRTFDWIAVVIEELIDLGMLLLGLYLISQNLLLGTNLLVLYMYRTKALGFIRNFGSMMESKERFTYALKRILEIVDGKTYSMEQYGTVHIPKMEGDLVFENVSFGYRDKAVLTDVSFHIKPNETVGIVGKSGAGKSTIFSLIPKLYEKNQGSILFDGVPIEDLTEESLRGNISYITQNPYLFNMTIRDNLKIVKPEASDEEMIFKSKLCAFDDYVKTLEKGYDTLIGEGGVILSGGLRQRLAIARALMKESEIILLDEATSALDNETQDFIKDSIHKISKDYTILIIAHRLSTIKDCDRILVVDEGKIVGEGTHEELLRDNLIYQQLYRKENA